MDIQSLPNKRDYVELIRRIDAHFDEYPSGTAQLRWNQRVDREQWVREKRKALNARINHRGASRPRGRKHTDLYQTQLLRDCRAIRDNLSARITVHYLGTPEMRQRYGHLLETDD